MEVKSIRNLLNSLQNNLFKTNCGEKIIKTYITFIEKCQILDEKRKIIYLNEFLKNIGNEKIIKILFHSFILKESMQFTYFQSKNYAEFVNSNFNIGKFNDFKINKRIRRKNIFIKSCT